MSEPPPNFRFLRIEEVHRRVGFSVPNIYKKVRLGEFPKPTKIGRLSVWPDYQIHDWQLARMGQSA